MMSGERGMREAVGHLLRRTTRPNDTRYGELIGCSPQMRTLFGTLRQLEGSGVPVLVQGPTGSGKEVVCREIRLFVESRGSMKASFASPDTALAARDRRGVSRAEARARRRFLWAEAVMLPWREASGYQGPGSA